MKDTRKAKGKFGEDLAAAALIEEGYEILQRNYRQKFGEIDIIAFKDNCLYFVEVRSKSNTAFGEALESINKSKKSKLIKTAQCYMAEKGREYQSLFLFAAVNLKKATVEFITDSLN